VKTLTKTEEEGTIIINRPDRSTYPEEKSVLRSGATPAHEPTEGALPDATANLHPPIYPTERDVHALKRVVWPMQLTDPG